MFCSLMENVALKTCGSNDSSRTSQCEAEHVNWISFLATVIHVRMKHRCCRGRRKSYSRTSIRSKNFNHIQELQSLSLRIHKNQVFLCLAVEEKETVVSTSPTLLYPIFSASIGPASFKNKHFWLSSSTKVVCSRTFFSINSVLYTNRKSRTSTNQTLHVAIDKDPYRTYENLVSILRIWKNSILNGLLNGLMSSLSSLF